MTNSVLIVISSICGAYAGYEIFNRLIFPKLIKINTKEIEKNPKWITSKLEYYGFHDIDFILCESNFGMLPRLRINKNKRIELLIDQDTSTNDIDTIGQLALASKIKILYGMWFPEKPIYWLSILCYMLDGGDIKISATSWEEKEDNKPID